MEGTKPPADADPLLGTRIAGYVVEERIGAGGMGRVYRGYDSALRRPVAIKLLLPQHELDSDTKHRFQREATLAAGISHPNVASVYAFELTDDDLPALIMEFIEGKDLATVLKGGPLDRQRALRIFKQTALALSVVHAEGLVHRDVKPENILLRSCGSPDEQAMLTDFGIAKSTSSQTALTVGPLGTVQYMSPEVVDWLGATELSDQYSLACTLFQMLTGEVLFGDLELPAAHKSEEVPDLEELIPGVSPASRAAIARALEKDPAKRFPSVQAFADAMDEPSPTATKPPSLHSTMAAALEHSTSLSLEELAEDVNRRRAGLIDPVTPMQVDGRARLFSQLFTRREDGRVELRNR